MMAELFTLCVAGTRTLTDYGLVAEKLDLYTAGFPLILMVTGEWRSVGLDTPAYVGADLLAEKWAHARGHPFQRFEPPFGDFPGGWAKKDPRAFHARNREMVEWVATKPEALRGAVLFWDGESPGTSSVRDLLKKHNIRTKTVYYKGG